MAEPYLDEVREDDESDPQTYTIIGGAMRIHGEMGNGYLEPVYHECLQWEFRWRNIPFEHEVPIRIEYRGQELACKYRCDYICFGEVILEVKVVERLVRSHYAQLIHYLKATGLKRGLLVNFGADRLEVKRIRLGY